MKIVFTPSARDQFLRALAYIRRDKPSAAVSFRQKAGKVLVRLRDYPGSGRILPEFPDSRYREVIVTPYRFFYREKDDIVWIVAVWHGAQIPEDPAEKPAAVLHNL
ncbi:type II toxin-antitoxin system RelE/ParE family toxin [Geobacter sp.]|uniref:type II toxin-antitoxin system RelE/ParE family toxin n=1 Tax=Geobacter sp. TaxID=46610 RepID=UPI00262C9AE6|nr:type II toxin-antitoxin system RelE/ParE family toxin [Geobacter sp.]